ncbi:hypothetical protein TPL01_07740 [Sulfuriferula plumbiphila]|uniref:Uncharacterized protein n=1 Tax=Sulfuriferula plumbiphila TaxID=171865 RepID=A0A512L578_9PROT|nr:hypothetical protein [Sulfuriferula plumbiphila]BBP05866.1 hypothetical protein SFPGR_32880 [Sulfuriferula plumbiphila]GEP29636.1 hypothetical protein TPL01_07740 [Sulfuriferula plumbiphila]
MKFGTRLAGLFTSNRRYLLNCAALIGLILALIAAELYHVLQPDENAPQTVSCPDPAKLCRFEVAGRPVELRFSAPPSGLHPFTLLLHAPAAREVYASFIMRGMDMGFNRYHLLSSGAGNWQAQVLLPVCITGRRDWVLTLTVDGTSVEIPFHG